MGNQLFNENVTYYNMFLLADKAKTVLEKERDALIEQESLSPEIETLYKRKLQSIYRARNNSFVLLLRNGLKCKKVEKEGEIEIIMEVDGVSHSCKETALKTILQKEYDMVIKKCIDEIDSSIDSKDEYVSRETTQNMKIEAEKKENKKIGTTETLEKTVKEDPVVHEVTERNEAKKVQDEENLGIEKPDIKVEQESLKETIIEEKTLDENENKKEEQDIKLEEIPEKTVQEIAQESKIEEINENTDKMPQEQQYKNFDVGEEPPSELTNVEKTDSIKRKSQMLMDIYTITVNDIENDEKKETKHDIVLRIVPLSVPEGGTSLSSDILVYMESQKGNGVFYSNMNGRKTVVVDDKMHSFLVTGAWNNGKFISTVRPTNKTLIKKAEINRDLCRVRPTEAYGCGIGHNIILVGDNKIELKVHCIPVKEDNEKDGYAATIYCVEDYNQEKRYFYKTKDKNHVIFEHENNIYKLLSKWENDTFGSAIEKM